MNIFTERLRLRLAPNGLRVALLLLLMMAMFSVVNWTTLPRYLGLDFCELWGIAKSQQGSGFVLGSPYRNQEAYQLEIKKLESVAADKIFTDANSLRKGLDLPGTPLLFAAFSVLPAEYRLSLWIFRLSQLIAFVVSVLFLCRFAIDSIWPLRLAFATLLTIAYDPLSFDLEVGNVNSLQLLALIGCARLTVHLRGDAGGSERLHASAVAALATLLGMLKPNIGPPLLMLAICVLIRAHVRARSTAAVVALVAAAVLAALAALFFNGWAVWPDWWSATFGSVDRLSYSIDTTGNRSTSLYLAQLLGLPTSTVMLAAMAVLPLSFALAAFPSAVEPGSRSPRWNAIWAKRLKDPYFCIGAGLLMTFASSPLVWPHYFILGLIPAFWLLKDRRPLGLPAMMGFLAILMMGGLPQRIAIIAGGASGPLMTAARMLAWTPLWLGMLINLRDSASRTD